MFTSRNLGDAAQFVSRQKMHDQFVDRHSVVRQIRILRLKLGSTLDSLEAFEPAPKAVEALAECTECIADEVDRLEQIVRQMTGQT
jgi:hypothetical protein